MYVQKTFVAVVGLGLLLAITPALWAEVGVPDPLGGLPLISDIKTHPLVDSEFVVIPIHLHVQDIATAVPNWAGYRLEVHLLDGDEVSITPNTVVDPFGAGTFPSTLDPPFPGTSDQNASSAGLATVWHPNALNSGTVGSASDPIPILDLELHAKNTTIMNNSDTDVQVRVWNIRHLNPGPGSTMLVLQESDYMYGTANFNQVTQSELPPFVIQPREGTWFHVGPTVGAQKVIHVPAGLGSAFYATLAGTALIGIEHVPEPTSIAMVLGGVGALVMARVSRRRRA